MGKITVVDRDGVSREAQAESGLSIMEIVRSAGFDELMALCGGCCSCATCHIYLDGDPLGAVPVMTEDENDLLESSHHRTDRSRLSCQIHFSDDLEGIVVILAPEE